MGRGGEFRAKKSRPWAGMPSAGRNGGPRAERRIWGRVKERVCCGAAYGLPKGSNAEMLKPDS